MFLFELFDTPYRFARTVTLSSRLEYVFKTQDDIVKCRFQEIEKNKWIFGFTVGDSDEITGKGDSIKIFATVIEIVKEFLKTNHGKLLHTFIFESKASDLSRIRLYDRFAKQMPKLGFILSKITDNNGKHVYEFTKNQIYGKQK